MLLFQMMFVCCFAVAANASRKLFLTALSNRERMTWFATGILSAVLSISFFIGMFV